MTLSHGPWLVLLSRMVAVQGNHPGRWFARNVKQTGRLRRFALPDRALLTSETGVQSMRFVGMRPTRNACPLNYPFPSKSRCHSTLAGSVYEHPPNKFGSQNRAITDQPFGAECSVEDSGRRT